MIALVGASTTPVRWPVVIADETLEPMKKSLGSAVNDTVTVYLATPELASAIELTSVTLPVAVAALAAPPA